MVGYPTSFIYSTSNYLAWCTSDIGRELENEESDIVLEGHSIIRDNAFVENMAMSTPIPGYNTSEVEDSYNFYLSQLRITIERAFGILVHRWNIMRRPLTMSALKVPALVACLMKLHNFCIDHDSRCTPSPIHEDERFLRYVARRNKARYFELDTTGRPTALIGSRHHFRDAPDGRGRRPLWQPDKEGEVTKVTPMHKMIEQLAAGDFRRPPIFD